MTLIELTHYTRGIEPYNYQIKTTTRFSSTCNLLHTTNRSFSTHTIYTFSKTN